MLFTHKINTILYISKESQLIKSSLNCVVYARTHLTESSFEFWKLEMIKRPVVQSEIQQGEICGYWKVVTFLSLSFAVSNHEEPQGGGVKILNGHHTNWSN